MSEEQIPPGITAEDWAATPLAVQEWVVSLLETVVALQKRVAELEERVNQTSRNSSKPPSSDPPNAPPRPKSPPSGRKAGGQPGHVGHGRSLKPVAQVKHVVVARPTACAACGALLLGEDAQPVRHQVTELPRIEPEVTDAPRSTPHLDLSGLWSPYPSPVAGRDADREFWAAGTSHGGVRDGPAGSQPARGGRNAGDRLSYGSELGQHPGVGTGRERGGGPAGDRSPDLCANAAGPERGRNQLARAGAAGLVVGHGHPAGDGVPAPGDPGGASAKIILGEAFQGIVGSDRWSAYNWLDPARRQLCWAHLKRDFQAFVERGGEAERIGRALLSCVEQMFSLWHRVRDGPLTQGDFQAAMPPIQARVGELLREGAHLSNEKTGRTCAKILKLEVALWTFVRVKGVEPTNNGAERPLRRAVLWRRRSFWTQSADGSRFVERILTVVTTLRQQKRDVLDYLTEACAAAIRGDPPPALLPKSSALDAAT